MSTDTNTQPTEDTKDLETVESQEETTEETTLEESLEVEQPVEVKKPKNAKPETVPFDTFIEVKKELQELKKNQNSNSTQNSTIAEIAKEFDVDESFVSKLANAIKTQTVEEFESKYSSKLAEIEYKTKKGERDKKFDDLFNKTLEMYPEFNGIANKEIIKQLALNPENGKKKLSAILEEVYGHTIQGKKTMETAQPNGGRENEETVDFSKASDPAVYARIKSDPKLKKEYSDYLVKNLNL